MWCCGGSSVKDPDVPIVKPPTAVKAAHSKNAVEHAVKQPSPVVPKQPQPVAAQEAAAAKAAAEQAAAATAVAAAASQPQDAKVDLAEVLPPGELDSAGKQNGSRGDGPRLPSPNPTPLLPSEAAVAGGNDRLSRTSSMDSSNSSLDHDGFQGPSQASEGINDPLLDILRAKMETMGRPSGAATPPSGSRHNSGLQHLAAAGSGGGGTGGTRSREYDSVESHDQLNSGGTGGSNAALDQLGSGGSTRSARSARSAGGGGMLPSAFAGHQLAPANDGMDLGHQQLLQGAPSGTLSSAGPSTALSTTSSTQLKAGMVDVKAWSITFSELEIIKQVGEGAFGRVYMAKWCETLVAVKLLLNTGVSLDTDDMQAAADLALSLSHPNLHNLHTEATLMARLRHPNIVNFLGVCPTPPCVVSEYCSKGSLRDVLAAAKAVPEKSMQLDWGRRLQMALDAAKGMLYLHQLSPPIIHRDLKSPNLLVDGNWRVKVSDFNLSKIMEESVGSGSSMTANNPRWLAPEVLDGKRASFASDAYSYGVVLWELETLELPWNGCNHWQIMKSVTEGKRLPLPDRASLPRRTAAFPGLDRYESLIMRCWAEVPEERPNFAEIIASLRDLLSIALKHPESSSSVAPQRHGAGGGRSSPSAAAARAQHLPADPHQVPARLSRPPGLPTHQEQMPEGQQQQQQQQGGPPGDMGTSHSAPSSIVFQRDPSPQAPQQWPPAGGPSEGGQRRGIRRATSARI